MSSSLSKILKTGIFVFKSNYQVIKIKTYYKISTIYECVEKLSMIFGCNIWMICLELNWFFTIRVECCNFLNLYELYVLWYGSFLTIFSVYVVWKFCLVNNCQQNIFYVFPIFVCLQILIVDEWKCKQTRQLCCESGV